jgi:hypothetical protein
MLLLSGRIRQRERVLHRLGRDGDETLERPVHIGDQCYGAGKRRGADQEGRDGERVERREKPEAHEQEEEPDDEDQDKRMGNMAWFCTTRRVAS